MEKIEQDLERGGFERGKLCRTGQFVTLDATEVLPRLFGDGAIDKQKFEEVVGSVIRLAVERSAAQFAFIFGEMVAVLCEAGDADSALRLERLWYSLTRSLRFSLYCAYHLSVISKSPVLETLPQICAEHSLAIPAEGPL